MCDLQFYPFTSLVETSFWDTLIKNKINVYKLNNEPISLIASYRIDCPSKIPSIVSLNYESFESNRLLKLNEGMLHGKLIMFNTIEEFKEANKKKLIQNEQENVWNSIRTSSLEKLENLDELLARFILLAFVDIKKYKVVYWFSFPAFDFPKNSSLMKPATRITSFFTSDQLQSLKELFYSTPSIKKTYFIVSVDKNQNLKLHSITDYERLMNTESKLYIAFSDPSTDQVHPGWILRNLLAFLYIKFSQTRLDVLAIRIRSNSIDDSLMLEISLADDRTINVNDFIPDSVGFERNESKKLSPKIVDLSSSMDPKKLVETAVDLNLKLMRWRLMPSLKLETIGQTKCLLLGSGTLGCNVARALLGWGINNITFVDNGKVSYSNPVRQSLFEYTDSMMPAKNKCDAASDALKRINPNVNSTAVNLSIPMPGHFVGDEMLETTKQDIRLLEQLIDEHDCVFLLMDTRESRWLPTLICHSKQKLVINAALGFDTYLVQRHGYAANDVKEEVNLNQNRINGSRLGCYYCNDVVAPGDSTKNRTLDQQCTVTRPGVSMIAAALAVELMVSVLQHADGIDAPAYIRREETDENSEDEEDEDSLGIIPHQIRGFLSQFNQVLPTCLSYKHCTACSPSIVKLYREEGINFLIKVFNDCSYLEDVSGLKQIQEETDLNEVWELDSD